MPQECNSFCQVLCNATITDVTLPNMHGKCTAITGFYLSPPKMHYNRLMDEKPFHSIFCYTLNLNQGRALLGQLAIRWGPWK